MNETSSITSLKGIGEKTKELFAKMGVYTVGDILLHFPRTYIRYPKMEPIDEISSLTEENHAIVAQVRTSPVVKSTRRMQLTLLTIGSVGHKMQLIWYRQPYIRNNLKANQYYVFYGKVTIKEGKYVMEQPVIYEPQAYTQMEDMLFPVYSLTGGVSNNLMIKTIRQALAEKDMLYDYLPTDVREKYALCEYNYAIKQIHFPDSFDTLIEARKRLVFDEFFLFILGMQYQKEQKKRESNAFSFREPEIIEECIEKLPYELTGAQKRALDDVIRDMQSPYVMQRLIQGDVGSGKTIVAFLAMAWTAASGYQSAIMAPTEVLARQHYESYCQMSEQFGLHFPIVLLTGSMTAKEKRLAYQTLDEEKDALVIGTHALIQEKAIYSNLALVITDEQHRFGVRQRETFAEKGRRPHILVMSATPIPRTLAIILYGDLDISVIDEVPARRLPIKNCVVNTGYRPKAYAFIEEQVRAGHQAYIICPLVEGSENMEGENVTDYAGKVKSELPSDIEVSVLHGKMKNDKKNEIMNLFAQNKVQVLVSTTVVEVGVNVPNATVMMIENADRFGLAQLHQLRGRVGRGDAQSYCIMINTSQSKNAKKRLEILNQSNDGFKIASEDLRLRGPGDFFGIRQSGDLAFQLADIYQDAPVLQQASEAVSSILEEDPDLAMESHAILQRKMDQFLEDKIDRMNL
jgi:ATP-dependent DNA helicase RecG